MSAVPAVQPFGAGVLLDLDALAQQCCGEIKMLAKAAINAISLDPDALADVRQMLLLVTDRADTLGDAINATAEQYGCNYVDNDERAFADRLRAKMTVSAGRGVA